MSVRELSDGDRQRLNERDEANQCLVSELRSSRIQPCASHNDKV